MRVIIKEPGRPAREANIDNTLEEMQRVVGGYIMTIPIYGGILMVVNEDGHLIGLPYNFRFVREDIVGTAFFCVYSKGDFRSLTDEQADWVKGCFE